MRGRNRECDKLGGSETVGQVTISCAKFNCVRWPERMEKNMEDEEHPRVDYENTSKHETAATVQMSKVE